MNPWLKQLKIALLLFGSISLTAQDKQTTTTVFTSGTTFVQVPVIVQRSGKHVSGLKKEVFSLRQDGKEQSIATFEEVHAGSTQAPEAQDQSGNKAGPLNVPRQITIIAMDMVNTPNLDRTYFIQEFARYLAKSGKFDGPVGLVAIERSGIRVLKGFTNDPHVLMEAISEHSMANPTSNSQGPEYSRQLY